MINKEQIKAFIKETLDTIIFVVIGVIIIRFFLIELRFIPSGSMLPTLVGDPNFFKGDRIVVEKVTKYPQILSDHKFGNKPKRGDVMVFYPPRTELKYDAWSLFKRLTGFWCNDVAYIKRVIGLPGEKFEIKQETDGAHYVYINDKRLDEPYIMSEFDYNKCNENMYCGPFVIPEKQYFMMGDNRGHSEDSRFWGTLSEDRFIGRAVFVILPLSRMGLIK